MDLWCRGPKKQWIYIRCRDNINFPRYAWSYLKFTLFKVMGLHMTMSIPEKRSIGHGSDSCNKCQLRHSRPSSLDWEVRSSKGTPPSGHARMMKYGMWNRIWCTDPVGGFIMFELAGPEWIYMRLTDFANSYHDVPDNMHWNVSTKASRWGMLLIQTPQASFEVAVLLEHPPFST
jgi:hypothetical protein